MKWLTQGTEEFIGIRIWYSAKNAFIITDIPSEYASSLFRISGACSGRKKPFPYSDEIYLINLYKKSAPNVRSGKVRVYQAI